MSKATMQDVAATAGVSMATVDRVLNNRNGVRDITRKKVRDALRKLDYTPNTHAVRLSTSKTYRLLFVVPSGSNSFMDKLCDEIAAAAEKGDAEGMRLETRRVAAFDEVALAETLESLSPDEWDGTAVVAPDLPLIRQAIDGCVKRGIRVVTLVSDIPSSKRSFYVGIDNITAGRVAGRLLGRFTSGKTGKLAIIPGSLTLSDHMDRFMGCGQIVRKHYPHLEMLPPVEGLDNVRETEAVVNELLRKHGSGIVAIYNAGAGNRGLIAALKKNRDGMNIVVVAHELSAHSRAALLDGTFDVVLSQNAEYEVQRAATVLRQLCDGGGVGVENTSVHADIFLADNLP